jgi:sphinganine-1-phosphate aldolase
VAFGSRDPGVSVLEVGDAMSKRGWHLNGISGPPAVHIACTVSRLHADCQLSRVINYGVAQPQRLTVPLVDTFIADLKDSVEEAKTAPGGKGNMVQVYGTLFYQACSVILFQLST